MWTNHFRRRGWLMLSLGVLFMRVSSAQDQIWFFEPAFDFGTIEEVVQEAKHTFYFINSTTGAVSIQKVNSSCGCTLSEWSKSPIMAGDSGFVSVSYQLTNRPGSFRKGIDVLLDTPDGPVKKELTISGFVRQRALSIDESMPVRMGSLRLEYKSLNMSTLENHEASTRQFDVYNAGDSAVLWNTKAFDLPKHIQVLTIPGTLMPKQYGKIQITYNPMIKQELGFFTDQITLYTNEDDSGNNLYVVGQIKEHFPEMTEMEKLNAPRLSFATTAIDLGVVLEDSSVEARYDLYNEGNTPLVIRQIKTNCGCLEPYILADTIPPGATQQLVVIFKTTGRRGRQYKTITLFTNDPASPSQTINLKAEIK